MDISYEHLKVFYKVAFYKSFTQAAMDLGTSQPAITRLINSLESQFGCKLFFRNKHSVSLTHEGEQLYAYVLHGVEQFEKGISSVAQLSKFEDGKLIITSNEISLRGIVNELLEIFHNKYPNITITLKNTPSSVALRELNNGICDFAFITSQHHIHMPLKQIICRSFYDIPIIGSSYQTQLQNINSLSQLSSVPYICMTPGHNTYDIYEEFYRHHGLHMKVDMFTDSFAMIMPMIEHNLGYCFMPDFIADESIDRNLVFSPSIKEKMNSRSIRMIYDTTYPLSVSAKAFMEITKEYINRQSQ